MQRAQSAFFNPASSLPSARNIMIGVGVVSATIGILFMGIGFGLYRGDIGREEGFGISGGILTCLGIALGGSSIFMPDQQHSLDDDALSAAMLSP